MGYYTVPLVDWIDMVAKSVTASQLSQILMECLFTHLQLKGNDIKAICEMVLL